MHTDHACSVRVGDRVRRDRAADPPVDLSTGELADEALARAAEGNGPTKLDQLAEAAMQLEVVLDGLAEADARVDPDPPLLDTLRDRVLDPLGEERPDVIDDVAIDRVLLHRPRVTEHVHEHDLATALRADAR